MDLVPKILTKSRDFSQRRRVGKASMWVSRRAEASPSSHLLSTTGGLEVAMGRPGKTGTRHPEEGAARGCRAAKRLWHGKELCSGRGPELGFHARVSEGTAVGTTICQEQKVVGGTQRTRRAEALCLTATPAPQSPSGTLEPDVRGTQASFCRKVMWFFFST